QAPIRRNWFLIHLARRSREPDASHLRRNAKASTAKPVVDQLRDVARCSSLVRHEPSRRDAHKRRIGCATLLLEALSCPPRSSRAPSKTTSTENGSALRAEERLRTGILRTTTNSSGTSPLPMTRISTPPSTPPMPPSTNGA